VKGRGADHRVVRVLVVADDILAVLYAGSSTSSQEFTADFKHHLGRLIVTFNGVSAEKLEYFFGVHLSIIK
jgi:hypothetical protein